MSVQDERHMMDDAVFTYDPKSDSAYIRCSDQMVLCSKPISENIILDLDEDAGVAGVEIIGLYWLMGQVAPEQKL